LCVPMFELSHKLFNFPRPGCAFIREVVITEILYLVEPWAENMMASCLGFLRDHLPRISSLTLVKAPGFPSTPEWTLEKLLQWPGVQALKQLRIRHFYLYALDRDIWKAGAILNLRLLEEGLQRIIQTRFPPSWSPTPILQLEAEVNGDTIELSTSLSIYNAIRTEFIPVILEKWARGQLDAEIVYHLIEFMQYPSAPLSTGRRLRHCGAC